MKGLDAAATLKEEEIQLKDTNVVSKTTSQAVFAYTDVADCKFYYNKIPLSTEIENKFTRECCMVFVKDTADMADPLKYNWICSNPENRCRG
jgi:hypothetical protein